MLTIDLNARPSHPLVEANWKQWRMPHFCGILTGDDTVRVMEERSHDDNGPFWCQTWRFPIYKPWDIAFTYPVDCGV